MLHRREMTRWADAVEKVCVSIGQGL
jgi:hypothetical protein